MLKENKGVTLVALVITIIVLLILAGVTLSMVMGDSGIFSKANKASTDTAVSSARDAVRLAALEVTTGSYDDNGTYSSTAYDSTITITDVATAVQAINKQLEGTGEKYSLVASGSSYKIQKDSKDVKDESGNAVTVTVEYTTNHAIVIK